MSDGLTDHLRESYVCETGKSTKASGVRCRSEGLLLRHRHSAYLTGVVSEIADRDNQLIDAL
jgi:hypothetical protein